MNKPKLEIINAKSSYMTKMELCVLVKELKSVVEWLKEQTSDSIDGIHFNRKINEAFEGLMKDAKKKNKHRRN